jgi:hypothetical protein
VSAHHTAGELLHSHEADAARSWQSNDDDGLSQSAVAYGTSEAANSGSAIHHHGSITAGDLVM